MPRWLYHPVRLIGKVIDLLEKIFRKILPKTPRGELAGGAMLVIGTLAVTGIGKLWTSVSGISAAYRHRYRGGELSVLSDACGSFSERRKYAGVRCTDLPASRKVLQTAERLFPELSVGIRTTWMKQA